MVSQLCLMCGSTQNCQTLCLGARPRYGLVVDEDVKKPNKKNKKTKPFIPERHSLLILSLLSMCASDSKTGRNTESKTGPKLCIIDRKHQHQLSTTLCCISSGQTREGLLSRRIPRTFNISLVQSSSVDEWYVYFGPLPQMGGISSLASFRPATHTDFISIY